MTRKRFVKLLMDEGYSRNSANEVAVEVLDDGFTYAEGYGHITRILPLVQAMIPKMSDAIVKATEAITRMATAVGKAASAALEAFNAAMTET